jgi:hypothetical protein
MPTTPTTAPLPSATHSEIYTYLVNNKGVSRNHALGIINNLQAESNMQYGVEISDPSESYTQSGGARGTIARSGGIAQWRGARLENLEQYMRNTYGEEALKTGDTSLVDYKTNWRAQIDFMLTEDETKKYLNKDFETPEDASKDWTYYWEVPGDRGKIQYFYDGEEYVMARSKSEAIRLIKDLHPNIDIKRRDLIKGEILEGKSEERLATLPYIESKSIDLGGHLQPETEIKGGTPVTEGEAPSSIVEHLGEPLVLQPDALRVELPQHLAQISPMMELQETLIAADDVSNLLPQKDQSIWQSGILNELLYGVKDLGGALGDVKKFNFNDWMDNLLIPKRNE